MKGRPSKNTVDYFPHFTTGKKTIFTLQSLYGNDGYAFWFKLLELLGSSDGHVFRFEKASDWLFLVAKTGVTSDKAEQILQTLVDLEAIDEELYADKAIWSDNFVANLTPVYNKRSTEIPTKPTLRGEKSISGEKTPQSKVKDSKGKDSKEKDNVVPPCPHKEIVSLYNEKLPALSRVKEKLWNGSRSTNLQARWAEDDERQSVEWWAELFESIGEMPFMLGENDKGWKADLGWIVKKENMVKIIEGKYISRQLYKKDDHNGFNQRDYQKHATPESAIPDFLK